MVCALLFLGFWVALAAPPAHSAEVFRCIEESAALRFVDRPQACEGAESQQISGRVEAGREAERVTPSAEHPASPAPVARDLGELLLTAAQAGPGWTTVAEAPSDVAVDADFVRWGVRDQRVRHYTRESRGMVQVCSIEIWRFAGVSQARAAAENVSYPDWQIDREDEMLVMIHGVTRAIDDSRHRGVFPACTQLGAKQRRRLAESAAANP